MPSLVLLSDGNETRYDLAAGAVVVGRSSDADIQVSEARASREHFRLEPTERGWVVRDLGSSNGTTVNGYFVSKALLAPGDTIEVGGAAFRFDGDGPAAAARAPRPPRREPSSGPAWIGAVVVVAAIAFVSDVVAVSAAQDANRAIVDTTEKAAHALFLVAARTQDTAEAERLLKEFVASYPAHSDAAQARARVAALEGRRETRAAAAADFKALDARAGALAPAEYRWRLESLLRRWSDVPDALDEIRVLAGERKGPAAPAEDVRVLFLRRKREADAAASEGRPGRALAMWSAHALESPPVSADAEADLRAEVRRIEDLASTRAQEALNRAAVLRDEGRGAEALQVLREASDALGETAGGVRVRARLDAASGAGGGRTGGGAGGGGPEATDEGYARRRALVLRAREAEQFVALRDYGAAAGLYAGVAGDAAGLDDLGREMGDRASWLRRVADLLEALRTVDPQGWKGKPWPRTWEEVAAADLFAALLKNAKKPEDRLALASFAYDQALRVEARRSIAQALEAEATHAEAERLYSAREGVAIPDGGFVAEKGEILSRDEWKRRRNAEAIAK
ncbi:MAG TPA: FHA domain-containing protein, partial [Planctomycetota bacterium]|nr:FHA domain-containing protein [Planctomycetota bacterium]